MVPTSSVLNGFKILIFVAHEFVKWETKSEVAAGRLDLIPYHVFRITFHIFAYISETNEDFNSNFNVILRDIFGHHLFIGSRGQRVYMNS